MTAPTEEQHVKLLFEVPSDDGDIEVDIETLWAVPAADGYQIDNIPFFARGIALGDVVAAEADEDGMLRYTNLVRASGHSTVRLWFAEPAQVAGVREALRQMGCDSEGYYTQLVAVDIPGEVSYEHVRAYLDAQESLGTFEYEEGCLADGVLSEG